MLACLYGPAGGGLLRGVYGGAGVLACTDRLNQGARIHARSASAIFSDRHPRDRAPISACAPAEMGGGVLIKIRGRRAPAKRRGGYYRGVYSV